MVFRMYAVRFLRADSVVIEIYDVIEIIIKLQGRFNEPVIKIVLIKK